MTKFWEFLSDAFTGNWFPSVLSIAAVAISFLSYRSGRPRLKVTADTASLVGESTSRPVLIVTVVNRGGARAPLSEVYVRSTDGRLSTSASEPGAVAGPAPALPHDIEPHGGRATWYFNIRPLQDQGQRLVDADQIAIRAHVVMGNRTVSHPDVIPLNGISYRTTQPRRVRAARWLRSLTRSSVQFHFLLDPKRVDLRGGTVQVPVWNTGRGIARGVLLELVRTLPDGQEERPVEFPEPMRVGVVPPRRVKWVTVPIDLPADGPGELTWRVRTRRTGGSSGRPPHTRKELEEILSTWVPRKNVK